VSIIFVHTGVMCIIVYYCVFEQRWNCCTWCWYRQWVTSSASLCSGWV